MSLVGDMVSVVRPAVRGSSRPGAGLSPAWLVLAGLVALLTAGCVGGGGGLAPDVGGGARVPAVVKAVPGAGPGSFGPVAGPGICGRTPEVQVALLRALAVEGPRMPCGSVDGWELRRLRELDVDAERLAAGDFRHLSGLWRLDVRVAREPLPRGVFAGMPGLRDLRLTVVRARGDGAAGRPDVLVPGVFEGLGSLERLELNGRRSLTGFRLDGGTLSGLSGLRELDVDSVAWVAPGSLVEMPGLRRVRLVGVYLPPQERGGAPVLPPGLFGEVPGLEDVGVKHFGDR